MNIKSPADLKIAIELAVNGDEKIAYNIYKYKWYNYYQNIHIKQGSAADIENEQIFKELEITYPELHSEIEQYIDFEIERLKSWVSDFD